MWQSVDYSRSQLPELVNLAHENYGSSEIATESFLAWQYEQNPAGCAVIQIAVDPLSTPGIVGQYVVIPVYYQVRGRRLKAALSLNTLTRESHRGQGIFTKLANSVYCECEASSVAFVIGFPNPNSYPGMVGKLAFDVVGQLPLLIKPLQLRQMIRARFGGVASMLSIPLDPLFRSPILSDKGRVEELNVDDIAIFDLFWEKIKDKYEVMGVRDAATMRWRYMESPTRDYTILGYRSELGSLLGYLVVRCTNISLYSCGMIVDFLVERGARVVGQALIQAALGYFRKWGVMLSGVLMNAGTEEFSLLRSAGFYPCPKVLLPQPFPFVYRNISLEHDPSLLQMSRWFLTMGDYDVI